VSSSNPRLLRLLYPEDGGRKILLHVGNLRGIASPPLQKKTLSMTPLRESQISNSFHNFMYDLDAVSPDTDKIPNPTAVVLFTQKFPAITAARPSSEIARLQIDIGGSILCVPSRGKMNSKFHHKIFCRK